MNNQPSQPLNKKLWNKLVFSGPLAPLLTIYMIGLPVLSVFRLALVLWQSERVMATGQLLQVFLQGLRVDLILLGLIILIPLLLSPLFTLLKAWRQWRYFTLVWLIISITLIVFLEMASFGFIAEYDVRPNRLFIEYLKYPQEVMPMLWNGFRVHVFLGLGALLITIYLMVRLASPWLKQENQLANVRYWILLPLIIVLVAFSIRSSLGHRPANPAMFAITNDNMVNSLILNSPYSVFYAIYNLKHEGQSSKVYGKMTPQEIMQEVEESRKTLQDKRSLLNDPTFPTLTLQQPSRQREKPLNIVIILEESLGATFVESLGGVPVTPELEKLKQDGWWFENLYATGTRSVRGIEAVVAGFPPTPARSVVKLSLSQKNFTTLASILNGKGYTTEFIYGGESHFDNMRSFFMGNGFQQVIEEKDYVNPIFVGSWGASDEDVFNRMHEQLTKHYASGKPFFTLAFSSSNHSPFEFPDGRIELYDAEKATENNAVKYADYAIGEFFKKAKASDYYKDTLFLVVADHDIRVRGEDLVPVKNFHIPGVILGADLTAKSIKTVASQIDLPTTLLSLAGIEAKTPMIGRDLSSEPDDLAGRAMMQYKDNYAWMEGQALVVLRPEKEPTFGHYDKEAKKVVVINTPVDGDVLVKRAIAHALLPDWLYSEQRYQTGE
ncbi:MAG: LTA synthase family protein [Methylophilaceae bacterium]